MDVTDDESIAAAIGRVEGCADAAGLDGLVCAAGVYTGGALAEECAQALMRAFDVNLKVDFPAPFWPMIACTSPFMSRKSTSDSAFTSGKYLVIFLISSLCTFRLFPPWGRRRAPP